MSEERENGYAIPEELIEQQHQVWTDDAQVRQARSATLKNTLKGVALITVLLWIALPIFWGSTWRVPRYIHRLTIAVVDFESFLLGQEALVGPAMVQAAQASNKLPSSVPHLGFTILPASDFPEGPSQVFRSIGHSKHWGALVVYPNCTSTWQSSLQTGNSSYDPTGCVAVVWSSARFYQYSLLRLSSLMKHTARSVTEQASKQAVRQYLQANASNATALELAVSTPQAVSTGMSYFGLDVRPITEWSVAAIFDAVPIYYLLLAFQLCLWGNVARIKTGWNNKLTFPSLVLWRIGMPSLIYIWLSLVFTTVVAAFQIPMTASVGHAGFVTLWALNYLSLLAVGLALESMLCLLTAQYLPFFLIAWIILNLTSSLTPTEVAEKFYRFVKWLPFYWMVTGYKIITYDCWPHGTRESLLLADARRLTFFSVGLCFGVLFAITAVHMVAITLFLALERTRAGKLVRQSMGQ